MSTAFELREHRFDPVACAAMDRSGERAERSEYRGVEVGAGARDDACGKGRCVELMLGAGNQHAVERSALPFGELVAEKAGKQQCGETSAVALGGVGALGGVFGAGCKRERHHTDDEARLIDSRLQLQM